MEKSFSVKQQSAMEFFRQNLIWFNDERLRERVSIFNNEMSAYYFMKDEIIIRNFFNLDGQFGEIYDTVVFTISDFGQNSKRELVNTYVYKIEDHDDVSQKLTLMNFNVSLK